MSEPLHTLEVKRKARESIRSKSAQLLDVIRRTDSEGRRPQPEEGER